MAIKAEIVSDLPAEVAHGEAYLKLGCLPCKDSTTLKFDADGETDFRSAQQHAVNAGIPYTALKHGYKETAGSSECRDYCAYQVGIETATEELLQPEEAA